MTLLNSQLSDNDLCKTRPSALTWLLKAIYTAVIKNLKALRLYTTIHQDVSQIGLPGLRGKTDPVNKIMVCFRPSAWGRLKSEEVHSKEQNRLCLSA
ncbi:hypothetical protein SERLA73DRAFT_183479 [Serpula lacrymans var. lacrymans S7.3]|uniref:Uncharacterized protein n=2 Tax=Serpula lacrymans var. lacrymans TaxID=341189 RepID=F8PZY5_SERL3|nr:uncharacterized protein SERLADRAFT_470681 [Serpula lacrymans var. lacrymans S7.9]EGN98457.1 hypothetical protein SERLA73DRAFT_183479 [Serpula lacrymans var. lacrymans S7.3]EGO24036.1 hypothetical protein SERLADRAFT_470681 [Serpula lacrymans var. lacrymans S7.9]